MTTAFADCFPRQYECSILGEIPAALPVWYYPGGSIEGGKDGVLVQVESAIAGKWVGVFAFGDLSPRAATGVYSCPDSSKLCVVSLGQGVYVSSDRPTCSEVVPLYPVMGVYPVTAEGVLVLHDFTRFVAYGATGIVWETPSLSWDGIERISIDGSTLRGTGWDAPSAKSIEFEISLLDGTSEGGSSPEWLTD